MSHAVGLPRGPRRLRASRQRWTVLWRSAWLCLACAAGPALAEGPTLRVETGMHVAAIRQLSADGAGRYLLTSAGDGTVRLWDPLAGVLLRTLRLPGSPAAAVLSPSGEIMAVAGRGEIALRDPVSGHLLRRLGAPAEDAQAISLAFSPDGGRLAAVLERGGLRVFDVKTGDEAGRDPDQGGPVTGADFDRAGRLVTCAEDGFIRLYQAAPRLKLLRRAAAPEGAQPRSVRFSPDGQRIAVGYGDRRQVDVLSGADLRLLFSPGVEGVEGGDLGQVGWSQGGRVLWAGGHWRRGGGYPVRAWAAGGQGPATDLPAAAGPITALCALPQEGLAVASAAPSLAVLAGNGKVLHAWQRATVGFREGALGVDRSGARVRFAYGPQAPAVFSAVAHTLSRHAEGGLRDPLSSAPGLAIRAAGRALQINGTALPLPDDEVFSCAAVDPERQVAVLGTQRALRAVDRDGQPRWRTEAPGGVAAVNVSGNGDLVVAALGDGTLRWYAAATGAEVLALLPHADGQRWVAWTPSGYHDASESGEDLLGWELGRGPDEAADFFPASLLRRHLYRPDVTARVLSTLDEGRALKEMESESGHAPPPAPLLRLLPPVVTILSPREQAGVRAARVSVRAAVRNPSGAPLLPLRAKVQGRDGALRGISLLPAERRDRAAEAAGTGAAAGAVQEVTVEVPPEDATVAVLAETAYSRSAPALLHLRWQGVRKTEGPKPSLYVLAVGVSKYRRPELRLDYPAKDARDLSAALREQQGRRYRRVEAQVLADEQASRANILAGLTWLRQRAALGDVAVIFLGGHGINAADGRYYFLPYDADLEAPEDTMVDAGQLQRVLGEVRGKVLLFLDSCHSGNVMGPRAQERLGLRQVESELASVESGVVVFAASAGAQVSRESGKWGNGAFTKAAVEGLRGKADYDRSGRITVSTLEHYISDRVRQLTLEQQTPTTAKPSTVPDFLLATVPVRPPLYKRWWFWGALGVAAAGVAAGIAFGVKEAPSPPAGDAIIHF